MKHHLPRVGLLLLMALPCRAQVGADCSVTVNGQSVHVNEDGSFLIQNVPAGNAVVRVTGTCIRYGVPLFGVSEFFQVPANQTVFVENLVLSPSPLPALISLSSRSEPPIITLPGGTSQILTTGLFADDSVAALDGLVAGSTYTSSNPGILTVDEDGVVTGVAGAAGTALLTTVNQGVTTVAKTTLSPGDPLTAVEGFVSYDSNAVAGAVVTLPGLPGMDVTDTSGHFRIPDVPSELGPIDVLAQATVMGKELNAFRMDVPPLAGGITDSGILALESCVEASALAVSWWKLDETSGTTSSDTIGGHDGDYIGNPVPAPGLVGGALDFDGNDYVRVPDNDLWYLDTSDFTIEFWAQFDTTGSGSIGNPGDVFLGHDEGGGSKRKWFFALGGGRLNFHVNGPWSRFFPQVPFTPTIGQWYHLAIVREGTLFTIYVNGAAQSPTATENRSIPNPVAPLTLGWAEGFGFDGRLDEMTFYRQALSPEVIQAIYLAGSAGKCLE